MEMVTCSFQLDRGLAAGHNSLGQDAAMISTTYKPSSRPVGGSAPAVQKQLLDMGKAARAAAAGKPNLYNQCGWPNDEVRKSTHFGLREAPADGQGGRAWTLSTYEEAYTAAAGGRQHVKWVKASLAPGQPPLMGRQQQQEGQAGREVIVTVLCVTQRAAVSVAVAATEEGGSLTELPIWVRAAAGAAPTQAVGRPHCVVSPELEKGAAALGPKTVTVALTSMQLQPGAPPDLGLMSEVQLLQLALAEASQQTQNPDELAVLDVLSVTGSSQIAPHLLHMHYGNTKVPGVLSSRTGAKLSINTPSVAVEMRLSPLDRDCLKYAVLLALPAASAVRDPRLLCQLLQRSAAAAAAFGADTLDRWMGAKPLCVEYVAATGDVLRADQVDETNVCEVVRTFKGLPLCCLPDAGLAVDPRNNAPRVALALTNAAAQFAVLGGHWLPPGANMDNGFAVEAGAAAVSAVGQSRMAAAGAPDTSKSSNADEELMRVAIAVATEVTLEQISSSSSSSSSGATVAQYSQSLRKLARDPSALTRQQLLAPSPVQRVNLLQQALEMAAADEAGGGAGEVSAGVTPPAKRQQRAAAGAHAGPDEAAAKGQAAALASYRRAQQALLAAAPGRQPPPPPAQIGPLPAHSTGLTGLMGMAALANPRRQAAVNREADTEMSDGESGGSNTNVDKGQKQAE